MLNPKYLKYIPVEKQEEIHKSLLRDIYYFYHGMKPDKVIQKNGNKLDVSRENLITMDDHR
jgi:hypothetical protein